MIDNEIELLKKLEQLNLYAKVGSLQLQQFCFRNHCMFEGRFRLEGLVALYFKFILPQYPRDLPQVAERKFLGGSTGTATYSKLFGQTKVCRSAGNSSQYLQCNNIKRDR